MVEFEVPEIDYTRYSNRQLAAIPLALLVAALLVIGGWSLFVTGTPAHPGPPTKLGIEFTGGTELTVSANAPTSQSQVASAFSEQVVSVRSVQLQQNTYVVTFQSTDQNAIEQQANAANYDVKSIEGTSPSFGQGTQKLALYGVVIAFVAMSIVVFMLFRSFVPSIAVVLSAFGDIVIPVALMNLLGISLSLGTVAALLMLIGYSVDSDILLNNHVLRRTGGFYESVARAMQTGVTMTVTSLAAMIVMTIVSALFNIGLLRSIGIILVFGLATDLMNTYMLNLSLLRWYKYEGVKR